MKPRSLFAVTFCLFIAVVALLPVQSFAPQPGPVVLGEFLYTVPLSKEKDPGAAAQEWYSEYLEPDVNDSLFGPLMQMISDNAVPLYKPVYPFTQKCTKTEARRSIIRSDSARIEDNPEEFVLVVMHDERRAEHIYSVTFHEVWTYDAATLTLVKTVKGIIPNVEWGGGIAPQVRPTVYIPFSTEPNTAATVDVSLAYRFVSDGTMRPPFGGTADVASDSAITANQISVQNQLLKDVRNKPADKKFTVYDAQFPFTRVADKAMKSTMTATLPVANSLQFYERWEVDPRNRTFRKTVKGIIPQIEKQTSKPGEEIAYEYRNLAFIPFGKFVPSLPAITTLPKISYDVNFRHPTDPYSGYVRVFPEMHPGDSAKLDSVAADIGEHIKRYEVKAYGGEGGFMLFDPFTNTAEALTAEEVRRFFVHGDSVLVEDAEDPSEVKTEYREWETGHEVNNGFRFYELWTFDPATAVFTKDIQYVGMNGLMEDRYGESGTRTLCRYFYYNPRTPVESIRQPQYLIASNIVSTTLLNENEFMPEDGEMGQPIVRFADTWHRNIHASQRYALFQPMIQKIVDGKLKVKSSPESQKFMTATEFSNMMKAVMDNHQLQVAKGMEFVLFNQLFFYEDWYYNPVTTQLYKEVKAVTFAHREPDRMLGDESYTKASVVEPCFTLLVNRPK